MKVTDKVLKTIQKVNSITHSPVLDYIECDYVYKLEIESDVNTYFKKLINKIDLYCDKIIKNIEDVESIVGLKETYSEALIYSKLSSLVHIKNIPESNTKTPDFEIIFRDFKLYAEVKSLSMIGGNYKYKTIMKEALNSQISLEDQINNGKAVASFMRLIQPYNSGRGHHDPTSSEMIINALINKIEQNLKKDQYSLGPTVLIVDFADQLLLNCSIENALCEHFSDDRWECISGPLWHVAFGTVGKEICDYYILGDEFNKFGVQNRNGILIEYDYIKGLIFHLHNKFFSFSILERESFIEEVAAM